MLLAHDPNSGDSEGGAGMSGERETQCSQAHVLSNNTVAELYIVSSRSREEQIYLNHSVEQFLYVQYYGTFF